MQTFKKVDGKVLYMQNKKEALFKLGSSTAKGGFKNEDDVTRKFNDWQRDKEAKQWLAIMGYIFNEIEGVKAIKLHGYKTDVQVQVMIETKKAISVENLSLKLVSNPQGYNQIDKRWVDKYKELWNPSDEVVLALKYYTGEKTPINEGTRDKRRMFFDEMDTLIRDSVLVFFKKNKIKIITDIIMGRGQFAARWMLVALTLNEETNWVLKSINEAMNIFGDGEIVITKNGNLKIGKITMQRKGGDAGRKTAQMLQFKINPCLLFEG